MHDHATEGGIRGFHVFADAVALRRHLDNAHDMRTNRLNQWALALLHEEAHKDSRRAEIEAAANLISGRLAEAPPAVVERVLGDRSMYLEDANGTLYLAEPVDPRHMPAPGPLYRLTEQVPSGGVDLLAATNASLSATRAYLDAHKMAPAATGGAARAASLPTQDEGVDPGPSGDDQPASPGPSDPPIVRLMQALEASLASAKTSESIPSDAPGEESGSAGRRPSPGAPSGASRSGGAS